MTRGAKTVSGYHGPGNGTWSSHHMTGAARMARWHDGTAAGKADCDAEAHICLIISIRLPHLLEARCELAKDVSCCRR
jgi:hypothetical protein